MSDTSIQSTGDGSPTLFSSKFNETYHSRHGALAETRHVFIQEGILKKAMQQEKLRVGEIGLGTGLNAWACLLATISHNLTMEYTSIEAFPPDRETILDYFPTESEVELSWYKMISAAKSGAPADLHPRFRFGWVEGLWPEINPFSDLDVLLYDAFSPSTQPEMWNESALSTAWRSLKPGGFLVTYCAKGEVKRTLKSLGFEIESPPGPWGKREMTRAIKL